MTLPYSLQKRNITEEAICPQWQTRPVSAFSCTPGFPITANAFRARPESNATVITEGRVDDPMSENEPGPPHDQRLGGWSEVKRRLDIELLALATGITKRQAADLMKTHGDKDYESLVREARWLRD